MARVISIHEYKLRRDADGADFERALRDAEIRVRRYLPTFNGRQFPTQELRIGGSGRLALANSYPPFWYVGKVPITD